MYFTEITPSSGPIHNWRAATILVLMLAAVALFSSCSSEKSIDDLRSEGKRAFFDENYEEARDLLGQALLSQPSDKEMLLLMADAYRRDYMLDSALFYLSRADRLYKMNRQINIKIYEVAKALEEWRKAIDAIKVLAETGDGFGPYNAELSYMYEKLFYFYNTWYFANEALKTDSLNETLYIQGARGAAQMDSTRLANVMIDQALRLIGPTTGIKATQATVLATEGKYLEAERIFRPLVEADSSELTYRLSLAHVLASQEPRAKREEAVVLYRGLVGKFPIEVGVDSTIAVLEAELAGEAESSRPQKR